ncbi:MAG TPA: hypothetical protein VGM89_08565, partial [Puia sp.]
MKINFFAKLSMLSLSALLFLAVGANAQLPDSHHFLWYKGHWSPSKKNVFIIEKDSNTETGFTTGSGTVTVDPDGTIHAESGGQDEWNKKIGTAVQQIDQWTQQLSDPANNIDLTTHHLNDLLLPDAQEEQQLWHDYKIDPKQDVLSPPAGNQSQTPSQPQPQTPAQSTRTMTDVATDFCKSAKADYDLVMAYYTAHKEDKDANLNIPPPPEFEYGCYACDSNIRKTYDTTIAHYVRDFMHPEDSILRKALGLMKSLQLLTGSDRGNIPQEIENAWQKNGACYHFSYSDLSAAVQTTISHLYRRAANLVIKYRRD